MMGGSARADRRRSRLHDDRHAVVISNLVGQAARRKRRPDVRGLDVPPELVPDAYHAGFVAELDLETETFRARALLVDDPLYLGSEQ